MFARGIIALLLLLALPAARAQAADPIAFAPPALRDDSYPVHAAAFADGVTGSPDIVYASYSGYRSLTLDLYLPPEKGRPLPLVLFVHGGSVRTADSRAALGIADFPATLARLAARGYAVASINYRLSGEARFPAQVQDVKAALAFLRTHAARYRIDPARAALWGASSGGELAALAAMSCGKPQFEPPVSDSRPVLRDVAAVGKVSTCVQGAVIWYGDMDLRGERSDPAVAAFLGCDPCSDAQLAAASPISQVSPASPPMLLVHGTADPAVSPAVAEAMAGRLKDAGVSVETLFIPDVGHGFMGKTPEMTQKANAQALDASFTFLDRVLSSPR